MKVFKGGKADESYLDELPEPAPRVRIRKAGDVIRTPTVAKWLIRDVLEEKVIALLTGPRGTYKSFIGLDWGIRVAKTGQPVLIVSAEGAGMDRRLRAWALKHEPDLDFDSLPLWILERRVDFNSPDSFAQLVTEIEGLEINPRLIVIDTLSKNSGGLDENSNTEVKAFIGTLDNGLKRKFNCTIVLVHHTGHVSKDRARGASALEADTDAAYVITREGASKVVSVSRERFKDSGDLPPLVYQAEVIELGYEDDDGLPVTSIALTETDNIPAEIAGDRQPRSGPQKQMLRVLRDLQAKADADDLGPIVWGIEELRSIGRGSGLPKTTARDVVMALCQFWLKPCAGGYRLPTKEDL